MKEQQMGKPRRVAISLELEWAYKRHLEVYAGCLRYADEMGWQCTINPAIDRMLKHPDGQCPYDGVLARATAPSTVDSEGSGSTWAKSSRLTPWREKPARMGSEL